MYLFPVWAGRLGYFWVQVSGSLRNSSPLSSNVWKAILCGMLPMVTGRDTPSFLREKNIVIFIVLITLEYNIEDC